MLLVMSVNVCVSNCVPAAVTATRSQSGAQLSRAESCQDHRNLNPKSKQHMNHKDAGTGNFLLCPLPSRAKCLTTDTTLQWQVFTLTFILNVIPFPKCSFWKLFLQVRQTHDMVNVQVVRAMGRKEQRVRTHAQRALRISHSKNPRWPHH